MRRSLKITAVGSAIALVVALAGCSSTSPSTSPSTSSSTSSSTSPSSSPSTGGGDNVLTIWTGKQSEVTALEAVGKGWSSKSGMTVEVSLLYPDTVFQTKVQAAARSGGLPDLLFQTAGGGELGYAQAGLIEDLTDDLTPSWREQFLPGVLESMNLSQTRIDNSGDDPATTLKNLKAGHYYSIPFLAGTPGVIFANKKLLEAAGVDTSKPPATWEEWVADIQKTTAKDPATGGLVTGLKIPETGYFWLYNSMAWAYLGPDAFNARTNRGQSTSWTSAESIKSLELYDQLSPLWTPGALTLGIDEADQAFASGKAAWDSGGTFTLSSLQTFGMDVNDVMLFGVPVGSEGKVTKLTIQPVALLGGAITTTSKHKAQALDFLKYLTSVEGATTFTQTAIDLSATKLPSSSLSSPLLQQLVDVVSGEGTKMVPSELLAGDPPGIAHLVAVDLTELLAKTKSVQQVAEEITTQYEAAWQAVK